MLNLDDTQTLPVIETSHEHDLYVGTPDPQVSQKNKISIRSFQIGMIYQRVMSPEFASEWNSTLYGSRTSDDKFKVTYSELHRAYIDLNFHLNRGDVAFEAFIAELLNLKLITEERSNGVTLFTLSPSEYNFTDEG